MSSSGNHGDYEHHTLIHEEDWDALREMLNSTGSSERFASTNFRPTGGNMVKGLNAFHKLCSVLYDDSPPPPHIVSRMVEIDENNLFEKVKDPSIGATPLHVVCEYQTESFVRAFLNLKPNAATKLVSEKDARGMTPLDVAWLMRIDSAYRTYEGLEDEFDERDGGAIAALAKFSCPNDSLDYKYAKDIWEQTVHMLFAVATEAGTATPTAWNIVQAIASTKVRCPNIAMWVALKLHPEQVRWLDRNGNFALHMAASCRNHYRYPIYPSGVDRDDRVSIVDAWSEEEEEGQTRAIIDEAQASPVRMLAEIYPEAASIPNNEGRYPVHLAAERGASWTDEMEHLFSAAPSTINKRDPKTMLFPFMLAAVDANHDASLDLVYKLLRANPANVKGGIQNTLYEKYLEEKLNKVIADRSNIIVEKDNAIAEKENTIADLRSELKRKAQAMDA